MKELYQKSLYSKVKCSAIEGVRYEDASIFLMVIICMKIQISSPSSSCISTDK